MRIPTTKKGVISLCNQINSGKININKFSPEELRDFTNAQKEFKITSVTLKQEFEKEAKEHRR